MRKLYVVRLSLEERARLRDLVRKGRAAAHKRRHAQALVLDGEAEARLVAIACSEPPEAAGNCRPSPPGPRANRRCRAALEPNATPRPTAASPATCKPCETADTILPWPSKLLCPGRFTSKGVSSYPSSTYLTNSPALSGAFSV